LGGGSHPKTSSTEHVVNVDGGGAGKGQKKGRKRVLPTSSFPTMCQGRGERVLPPSGCKTSINVRGKHIPSVTVHHTVSVQLHDVREVSCWVLHANLLT